MISDYIQDLVTYFKNKVLNSVGAERDLVQLIADKDIDKAISMMQECDEDVDNAIEEYNPQTHKIMKRQNKRTKKDFYEVCKLPRGRQRYINEVELFFLLGRPIVWKKEDGDDDAYTMFTDFLKEQHFNSTIRKAKRLAGAETESAKVYHIYRNDANKPEVKARVISRSEGYKLRRLFDQYGNLRAFAYGCRLKRGGNTEDTWEIQTDGVIYRCRKRNLSWEIEQFKNPTGKINVIYYSQRKAWEGVEKRIEREEELDSKVGDTNNYFADPIAKATADVINSLAGPDTTGKLIQLTGTNSSFEYVNPPQSSATRDGEKVDLEKSILFDTFTPNLDFDYMKGLGSLSGVAVRNAMILGFIKADNYKETYEELVTREKNLILAILTFLHPEKKKAFEELKIAFNFSSPFDDDKQQLWDSVCRLRQANVISLETAVEMLSLTDAPEEEVERIRADAEVPEEVIQERQQDVENEGGVKEKIEEEAVQ